MQRMTLVTDDCRCPGCAADAEPESRFPGLVFLQRHAAGPATRAAATRALASEIDDACAHLDAQLARATDAIATALISLDTIRSAARDLAATIAGRQRPEAREDGRQRPDGRS